MKLDNYLDKITANPVYPIPGHEYKFEPFYYDVFAMTEEFMEMYFEFKFTTKKELLIEESIDLLYYTMRMYKYFNLEISEDVEYAKDNIRSMKKNNDIQSYFDDIILAIGLINQKMKKSIRVNQTFEPEHLATIKTSLDNVMKKLFLVHNHYGYDTNTLLDLHLIKIESKTKMFEATIPVKEVKPKKIKVKKEKTDILPSEEDQVLGPQMPD